MLERGVNWLKNDQAGRVQWILADRKHRRASNMDAFTFMVLTDAGEKNQQMQDLLYEDRNGLSVYAKCMLAIAVHRLGNVAQRDMLKRNVEQFLKRDNENQTAWLEMGHEFYWWYWYGSEMEAHAYYLKLLAETEPQGRTAPALVKYLVNNRKHGTYWNSTRDTAIVLEAMADYIKASAEDRPDYTLQVLVDGKEVEEGGNERRHAVQL